MTLVFTKFRVEVYYDTVTIHDHDANGPILAVLSGKVVMNLS